MLVPLFNSYDEDAISQIANTSITIEATVILSNLGPQYSSALSSKLFLFFGWLKRIVCSVVCCFCCCCCLRDGDDDR